MWLVLGKSPVLHSWSWGWFRAKPTSRILPSPWRRGLYSENSHGCGKTSRGLCCPLHTSTTTEGFCPMEEPLRPSRFRAGSSCLLFLIREPLPRWTYCTCRNPQLSHFKVYSDHKLQNILINFTRNQIGQSAAHAWRWWTLQPSVLKIA